MIIQNFIFPFDYIILCISILFVLFSTWKGFISSILGLLTWVGSIIITIYTWGAFSSFIYNQLININLFSDYKQITDMIAFIISIPLIFLVSLFFLRKIRKLLNNDLDKQFLGIIFDKFFGLLYGFLFSYLIFSTILFGLENFIYFNSLNNWVINNSYILQTIADANSYFITYLDLYEENIN
tara:strand:+ start:84 stop:629 length:546 start_codon:yes stop_codon:yes gene_type:complete